MILISTVAIKWGTSLRILIQRANLDNLKVGPC